MTRIFISYSRRDLEVANWVASQLRERGFEIWIDQEGIRGGDRWRKTIEDAVHSCSVVIVLLSNEAAESNWVESEWQHALELDKLVIPVLLEQCDVPRGLRTRQMVHAMSDRVAAIEQIAAIIPGSSNPNTKRVQEKRPPGRLIVDWRSFDLVAALRFPFHRPGRVFRLLHLPILLTLFPLTLIGIPIARGWRLDVARRIGTEDPDPIPKMGEVGRHLGLGILLMMLRGIISLPPLIFVLVHGVSRLWALLTGIFDWLMYSWFERGVPTTLQVVVDEFLIAALIELAVPIAYLLIVWPIYRGCIIRYALTGKPSSLFELHKSIALVFRHLDGFLMVMFVWMLLQAIFIAISLPLIGTGVGIIGVTGIVAPIHYYMTAYLYGVLALRVRDGERRRELRIEPAASGAAA